MMRLAGQHRHQRADGQERAERQRVLHRAALQPPSAPTPTIAPAKRREHERQQHGLPAEERADHRQHLHVAHAQAVFVAHSVVAGGNRVEDAAAEQRRRAATPASPAARRRRRARPTAMPGSVIDVGQDLVLEVDARTARSARTRTAAAPPAAARPASTPATATNSAAVTSSTSGYCIEIGALQRAHRPREHQPAHDRDVLEPAQLAAAAAAARRRPHHRRAARQPVDARRSGSCRRPGRTGRRRTSGQVAGVMARRRKRRQRRQRRRRRRARRARRASSSYGTPVGIDRDAGQQRRRARAPATSRRAGRSRHARDARRRARRGRRAPRAAAGGTRRPGASSRRRRSRAARVHSVRARLAIAALGQRQRGQRLSHSARRAARLAALELRRGGLGVVLAATSSGRSRCRGGTASASGRGVEPLLEQLQRLVGPPGPARVAFAQEDRAEASRHVEMRIERGRQSSSG